MPPTIPPSHLRFARILAQGKSLTDTLTSQQQQALTVATSGDPAVLLGVLPTISALTGGGYSGGFGIDLCAGDATKPVIRIGQITYSWGSGETTGFCAVGLDDNFIVRVVLNSTAWQQYAADGTPGAYIAGPF